MRGLHISQLGSAEQLPGSTRFAWRDGERLIVFGRGELGRAGSLLDEEGWRDFELVTTARALEGAPGDLIAAARAIHELGSGEVPALAARICGRREARDLVALGGGRAIDTAKAVAAVGGGRVAALPTTLSGAEMTAVHRLPEGHRGSLVRPALVITDPELLGSAPKPMLRASAMNALGHGAEALWVRSASPVASLAGLAGARDIAGALQRPGALGELVDLARGALLCGFALGATELSLHHVACQSVVRTMGTPHAETNAVMLPLVVMAMGSRAPLAVAALAEALGVDAGGRADPGCGAARRIRELAGGPGRLEPYGGRAELVPETVEAIMARRTQLEAVPDPPDEAELGELISAAI